MDRLTETESPPHDPASGDPDFNSPRRTIFNYDGAGRLRRVTLPKGVVTTGNPDDFVTQYEYDPLDRVVSEIRLDGQGGARRTHHCYDIRSRRHVFGPAEPEGVLTRDIDWNAAAVVGDLELPRVEVDANPEPREVVLVLAVCAVDRVVDEVADRRNQLDVLHQHRDEEVFGRRRLDDGELCRLCSRHSVVVVTRSHRRPPTP